MGKKPTIGELQEELTLTSFELAQTKSDLEQAQIKIVSYRNEVRYMNDVMKRMLANMHATIVEFNERKAKCEQVDRMLQRDGFIHDYNPLRKLPTTRLTSGQTAKPNSRLKGGNP